MGTARYVLAIDLYPVCYAENQLRFEEHKKANVNNDGSSFDLVLPYSVITAIVRDDCVHTRRRSRDYHHRARCSGRGNAMHRRNAPFPRYFVVVPRYTRGSVNYAVFKYRFPWRGIRAAGSAVLN